MNLPTRQTGQTTAEKTTPGRYKKLAPGSPDDTVGEKVLKRFLQRPLHCAFLYVEKWFNLAFGTAMNPFYCLGSLTFFFLWIVLVSGIYLYIFYVPSIAGSYLSIESLTHEQWYLGGVMRSLHRYASDAAMLTTILHIFREFALDRYRGFRWFSWFTGVPPLWILALLGITGYWLVWDQLAQFIAISSARLMDALPLISSSMTLNFLSGNLNDRFFTLMTFLHLVGGPLILIFTLWIHVKRISNVEAIGPRGLAIGSLLALIVLSLIVPAVSHDQADLTTVPGKLNLDWFYLNIFPLLKYLSEEVIWILIFGITFLLSFMPWLPRKHTPPAAQVQLDRCNGCAQCFEDCPYDAISMQKRSDGTRWDTEAVVDPDLCASCGICVGSCPYSNPFRQVDRQLRTGIDMPEIPLHHAHAATRAALTALKGEVKVLVYCCNHGASMADLHDPEIAAIQYPCTGMLPVSFINYALKNGADGVVLSGCRSSDCYYRFGTRWIEQRINGERIPHLGKTTDRGRVAIYWAARTDKKNLLKEVNLFRQRLLDEKRRG